MSKLSIALCALSATLWVSSISAADKVIFVHGRSGDHCGTGTTDVNNYWGNSSNVDGGYEKHFVGYDGASDPRTTGNCRAQTNLLTVLGTQCTGDNTCTVICHSAGCYAMDYFTYKYPKYDINVNYILASAAATGGSELANLKFWSDSGMVGALKTGNARSFNHNITAGIGRWHMAGHEGYGGVSYITSGMLPGEDDGAVSYHSSCGKNSTTMWVGRSWWNWSGTSSDWDECKSDGRNWDGHYHLGKADLSSSDSQIGYNSGLQGYNDDHSTIKETTRRVFNAW